jgi:thioesterase domain-containing protein
MREVGKAIETMPKTAPQDDALLEELQATWHEDIPISRAMGIRAHGIVNDELRVTAGFAENRNVHGTAFAGSLYSVCVLTGWGAAWLALRRQGIDGAGIVVKSATIRYLRPITGLIHCRCSFGSDEIRGRLETLEQEVRSELELVSEIRAERGRAVEFAGVYSIRAATTS